MTSQTDNESPLSEEGNASAPWQSPAGAPDSQPAFGAYGSPASSPAGQPGAQPNAQVPPDPAGTAGQYAAQAAVYGPSALSSGRAGFVPAPKPGIIPLRPLSITEIISGAFDSLRANPRAMFLPSLILMTVLGVISAAILFPGARIQAGTMQASIDGSGSQDPFSQLEGLGAYYASSLTSAVIMALGTAVLSGLLIMVVSRSVLGRIASVGEVWSRVRPRIWALIGQTLLLGLISLAATVAATLLGALVGFSMGLMASGNNGSPGVGTVILAIVLILILAIIWIIAIAFFAIRLSLAPAALILENVGVVEGMRRSWRLTKGSFWRVLGVLLLATLITSTVSGLVTLPLSFGVVAATLNNLTMYAPAMAGLSFLTSLIQAAILPFSAAVTALIYIDLRMRKEGLDVELRQAAAL